MPRPAANERVTCTYFTWLLGKRNKVYVADGRGNSPSLGRHSLGTRDRADALTQLTQLDLVKAVENGVADASLLTAQRETLLLIGEGRRLYLEFVGRPTIQGGAGQSTLKRYHAVFDKFEAFAESQSVKYWQQINRKVLTNYNSWLEAADYHGKTQYIELTVLKQAIKWLISEQLLPPSSHVSLTLKKPTGTRTYCYSDREVQAIVAHCRANADLNWLAHVTIALAHTGLRISELAGLRWTDVKLDKGVIQLTDDSHHVRRSQRDGARTTKSHRDRMFPIHPELLSLLQSLERHPDNRVFHGPLGGKLKPDTVRTILIRDVLKPLAGKFPANGDGTGILGGRVHSFRHYFCSTAANNRIPEQMLMTWLGHRNSEMIRHYYHLCDEESTRQMQSLPSLSKP